MVSAFKSYSASSAPPVHPSIHPSIHEQTPLKKDTYLLGKNDVLPRTVHPHKSGYTSYEATHATSSELCSHDTSSTGTQHRRSFPVSLHVEEHAGTRTGGGAPHQKEQLM